MSASVCQKCRAPIGALEPRWMFVPDGAPAHVHVDKCQSCGEWTSSEQQMALAQIRQFIMAANAVKPGGCNCTGQR